MAVRNARKKRVSKKLKSSWRKHVNVNDVEEFLEEKRLEERLGPPLSTVLDADLFVVDTRPDNKIKNKLLTKKERKLRASRPVKCFSALVPYTKVPDPIAKRNRVRTKEERKNELLKEKEKLNNEKGILKRKEIQSIANRRLSEIKKESKEKRGDFNKDVWAEDRKFPIENDDWTSLRTKKHNLRGTGIPVKNLRKVVTEKPSPLSSIEPPHPGMSYNPSFEDHQHLLTIVADKEQKVIKEEEHLKRVTRDMFRKLTSEIRDADWLVQMSEGLPGQEGGTNVEENEASDNEYKSVNPPVKNKKKTPQQRRKQKEQLLQENARRASKLEKKKIGDIHKIKVLQTNLKSVEEKQQILREKRKKLAQLKKKEPKVLSSTKFEEPELEFNFGHDLAGNLRNIKKEGSLLTDRFKSLQKRNILEPSKIRIAKKAKVKRIIKPGHKGDWEKTVARKHNNTKSS